MLANAYMRLKIWDEAFLTTTFVINLLPSKVLNFETQTAKPNYEFLLFFGSAYWPIRPYNTRKLAFAIALFIKLSNVLTFQLEVSIFLVMFCSMKKFSLSPLFIPMRVDGFLKKFFFSPLFITSSI